MLRFFVVGTETMRLPVCPNKGRGSETVVIFAMLKKKKHFTLSSALENTQNGDSKWCQFLHNCCLKL